MSRWKAAAIHLGISAVVITLVASGLIALWYGWAFFAQMGGARQLFLMAVIDLVIGPMLTLIVFRTGKPSLRFDLTVIALLQIGFLAYGLNVMAQSRPVFLVAVLDRFELVFANQLRDEDLARASRPEYGSRSWTGPRLVGGRLPGEGRERLELAMEGLMEGRDIQHMPHRYVPYEEVAQALVGHAYPIAKLDALSATAASQVDAVLERAGVARERAVFLPIQSSRGAVSMLLEADTGRVLGPVALDPWAAIEAK